jgi:hypothetical protein
MLGIVELFDRRQREAHLGPEETAGDRERRGRRRVERETVPNDVAQALALQEELAASLLDDLSLHLARAAAAVGRDTSVGVQGVDDVHRSAHFACRDIRLRFRESQFGMFGLLFRSAEGSGKQTWVP